MGWWACGVPVHLPLLLYLHLHFHLSWRTTRLRCAFWDLHQLISPDIRESVGASLPPLHLRRDLSRGSAMGRLGFHLSSVRDSLGGADVYLQCFPPTSIVPYAPQSSPSLDHRPSDDSQPLIFSRSSSSRPCPSGVVYAYVYAYIYNYIPPFAPRLLDLAHQGLFTPTSTPASLTTLRSH